MRLAICAAVVVAVVAFPSSVMAEEPDLGKMQDLIQQLEQIVEGLLKRVASMEATLARAAGAPPGVKPPASTPKPDAQPTEMQPDASGIREEYDRFTGRRTIYLESAPVLAYNQDDKSNTISVTLLYEIYQEDDKNVFHQLYVEVRSPTRLWPEDTVVYMLMDGERTKIELSGYLARRNQTDVEYVSIRFKRAAIDTFANSKKVEFRVGSWELEVPPSFRRLVAQANKRAATPPSGR